MINLNINETKKLRFKISLSGVHPQDLKGALRIIIDDIEYGFPIKIENGDITSEIGPLKDICPKKVKNSDILNSKLEIIAGDTHFTPWSDKIRLRNPIKVEAKITDDDIKESNKLMTSEITDEDIKEFNKLLTPKIKISDISEEKVEEENINKIEESDIDKKYNKFGIQLDKYIKILQEKKS